MDLSQFQAAPGDSPVVRGLKTAALEKLAALPVADAGEVSRILGSKADFFSAASLRIRPKETEGGMAPFVFNPIQMDYLASLRRLYRLMPGVDLFQGVRDIILKPRQLGFTTFEAALYFFDGLFRPGRNTLVLTHLDKVSQKVLEIYRAFYDSLPAELRATVRLRRASALHLELEFLGPDGRPDPVTRPPSSFIVHTAAGFDLRGITVHNLHMSEAAFYENWVELTRGVMQAVPATGNIALESTANGFNHFKDLVDSALGGRGIWRLVFYPWFAHPEYRVDLTRDHALVLERGLLEDERRLMLEHRVDLGQLEWRRRKISELGDSKDSFRQEYPASVLDAFLSSGRPVFRPEVVVANWDKAKQAVWVQQDDFTSVAFAPDPNGLYVLSADPAEGLDHGDGDPAAEIGGTDYSSAYVICARTLQTMARLHGRIEPIDFARRLAALGHAYNDALVVVERNNHGHAVLFALEEAAYPNLYRHLEYDSAGQKFLHLGFPMNVSTRSAVIDVLAEVIRRDALPCGDAGFWKEAQVFVWGPDGKAAAMPSRHDDRVMSKAIGIYIVTLGAKAWGGAGVLQGADGAGLPMGSSVLPAALPPVPAAVPAAPPVPGAAPATPTPIAFTPGAAQAAFLPVPAAPMVPNPPVDLPIPPDPGAGAAHPALAALARARAEVAEDASPRCGNCAHLVDRNGHTACGAQTFLVKPSDPPCALWEPPLESYNVEVHRVSIGGVE